MNNFTKYSALVTTILLAISLSAVGPAQAAEPTTARVSSESTNITQTLHIEPTVVASSEVKVSFAVPVLSSEPVPLPPTPVEVIPEPVALAQSVTPIAPTSGPAPVAEVPAAPVELAPVAVALKAPVAAPASGVGAALVASAYSQLGVAQDCTRMVENALGSIGIITGDIGPSNFFGFGRIVGDPQPGDLMVQGNSHVAIYVGNGMAISGGFNGQNTVLHPASYLTGSAYVRVG